MGSQVTPFGRLLPRQVYTYSSITNAGGTLLWQGTASYNTNGTVAGTGDTFGGNWSYGYDTLNRVSTAVGPRGGLSYTIDPFGNKTNQAITSGVAPSLQGYQAAGTNALIGNGLTYDLSNGAAPLGNVTYDGFHRYTYDAEGRLYQVDGSTCYTYDGDGDRVARTNCNVVNGGGGTTTGILAEFLYDPGHRLMSEVNLSTAQISRANVWAGDQLIAEDAPDSFLTTAATATQLRMVDQVGTLRGLLDLAGHITESCTSFPYGDGVVCSSSQDTEFFTGKRRDTESDLDYFGDRYYNSTVGRWMSPDWSARPQAVPYADLMNPQSLNLYGYVNNNPASKTDADGHCCDYNPLPFAGAPVAFGLGLQAAARSPYAIGAAEIGSVFAGAPEVGAMIAEAATVTDVAAIGIATLGVTGTGVTRITGTATGTDTGEATGAVSSVTNPVAAGAALASGSLSTGSNVGDAVTVAKAAVSAANGKGISNPGETAAALNGAGNTVMQIISKVTSYTNLPPAPPAPPPPPVPDCSPSGVCL